MPLLIGDTLSHSNNTIQTQTQIRGEDPASVRSYGLVDSGIIVQTNYLRYDQRTTWSAPVNGNTVVSDLNITITPKFATSRILLTYMVSFEIHHDSIFRLARNGSEIGRNANDGNRWSGFANTGYDADTDSTPRTNYYVYIDSPATTSTVTYSLWIGSGGATARTLYMNRNVGNLGSDTRETAISFVMAQEIL